MKMRVFLAEDNVADVWLIEEALKRQSLAFQIDNYPTADEAIKAARDCGPGGTPVPDLILLDYNLPRGHGCDILAAAAENPNLASVPKAILSSFLQPAELQQALDLGASCFITKPANLDDFLRDVGTKVMALLKKDPEKPMAEIRSDAESAG